MSPEAGREAGLERGRGSVMAGLRWNVVSQVGAQVIRGVVTVILASLLGPKDFGLIAIAMAVVSFADMLIDLGSGQAVIQRRELSRLLVSSVFVLNLGVGCGLAVLVYAAAPLLATLLADRELEPVLQVMCLAFPVSAAGIVQRALLIRRMQFGRHAAVQFAAAVVIGAVGVGMATLGYGVWALVWSTLAGIAVTTAGLWWAAAWRPSLRFSRTELRSIGSFSRNLTLSNLVTYARDHADKLVLGRLLGPATLGIYSLSERLAFRPIHALGTAIDGALMPRFAEFQDRDDEFRNAYLRSLVGVAFVVFPLVAGLATVGEEVADSFFDEEWAPVAWVLALLAPSYAARALHRPASVALRAKDRTDVILWYRLIEAPLFLIAYFAAAPWGLPGVCIALSALQVTMTVPYMLLPCWLVGMRVREVAIAMGGVGLATAFMVAAVLGADRLLAGAAPAPAILAAEVAVGALAYALSIGVLQPGLLRELSRVAGMRRWR